MIQTTKRTYDFDFQKGLFMCHACGDQQSMPQKIQRGPGQPSNLETAWEAWKEKHKNCVEEDNA